jgi:hypothetical protein
MEKGGKGGEEVLLGSKKICTSVKFNFHNISNYLIIKLEV